MAEPLKNSFDERIPRAIARQIKAAWPRFDAKKFLADVLEGYDGLELMDRGRFIARSLARYLPANYPDALEILMKSIEKGGPGDQIEGSMASFFYLPHTIFTAEYGLEHFDESMRAQYRLTQLFTAEFSVRPFIERYERESLALLREWAADPSHHVRRLVSEGTRPRLPWAGRLRRFQQNPAPVLALLELLKDDPEIYVRRSVANNLNDIGKDNPEVLIRVARRWMRGATGERRALVRHALRSLVKQGNRDALEVLGFGGAGAVSIENVSILPKRAARGGRISIAFEVRSRSSQAQRLMLDMRIHFIKANGKPSPKVFKLKALSLPARGHVAIRKAVSLADLTTRSHYPGRHSVDVLINGRATRLGAFDVI